MESVEIYQHDIVKAIREYYGNLLFEYSDEDTIRGRLEKLAIHLWKAYEEDHQVVLNEINNYHPNFFGKTWKEIKSQGFQISDAYHTIAKEYGYDAWKEVPVDEIDITYEKAIDSLLQGDQKTLKELFINNPTLQSKKSQYGHGASLIHYVGSNGFEFYRQVVPLNLPILLDDLINMGCNVHAKMKVYGGEYAMIDLLNTSAHPKEAGILHEGQLCL